MPKNETPLHRRWRAMIERCKYVDNYGCRNHAGRGIKVCRRWCSFDNFVADMGRSFRRHFSIHGSRNTLLDRRNNNGHYTKGNCHWVTSKQNRNNARDNRRFSFNRRTLNIRQWSERTGLNYETLRSRFNKGWPAKRALAVVIRTH